MAQDNLRDFYIKAAESNNTEQDFLTNPADAIIFIY